MVLLALLCVKGAYAQEVDESVAYEAKETPQITQVGGSWTGTDTVVDNGQTGPMTLDLTQDQKEIGGTFSVTNGDETPAGSVIGKIHSATLKLTFHATSGVQHDCTAAIVATVDGDAMSGTFLVKGDKKYCSGKGTFDLQLQ